MKHATKKTHDTPELDAPEIEAQPEEDSPLGEPEVAEKAPRKSKVAESWPEAKVSAYLGEGKFSHDIQPAPQLPATRAECETLMDTKHQHIAEAEARLLKAKAELDKLIGHHNNLPK